MLKIGTQNQAFFPEDLTEKFEYLKEMGFESFEIDGKVLVENLDAVKQAIAKTGLPVSTACGGYDGWIGDFNEEKRLNGLQDIKKILEALAEVGGVGIIVPAAWGMFTYRLPPHVSPRSEEDDRKAIMNSLDYLDTIAEKTGTKIFLEPLNRYQDHMLNLLADARSIIVEGAYKHVEIMADFYHMNIEEDDMKQALLDNKEYIGHIHLADNHRYQPGTGTLDFKSLFDTLKSFDYKGYMVYEGRVRSDNPDVDYKASLAYLHILR